MTKREAARTAILGGKPPYVPWSFGFTAEARQKLDAHYGSPGKTVAALGNHFASIGAADDYFETLPGDCVRDPFGVVWDRSRDRDIGVVRGQVLPEPSLADLRLPDPDDPRFWGEDPAAHLAGLGDYFRTFNIGFSLYERAWTLRGMETFLTDLAAEPEFAGDLLNAIADFNIQLVRRAVRLDIDAVYFGDDWGDQRGLQMGPRRWREMILPILRRMYAEVRGAGKLVYIHSCGKVDEVFDDLVDIGLNCFNPFQPEVMDVEALLRRYRGRLAFHGGLSTQKTLPYGSVAEVRAETERLLELGAEGGYILSPAHAVEGDVPLENMLAFIDLANARMPR